MKHTEQTRSKLVLLSLVCLVSLAIAVAKAQAQSCQTSCPVNDGSQCYPDQGGNETFPADPCLYPGDGTGCPDDYDPHNGCCTLDHSPIIFDLTGGGFHISDAAHGVLFKPYPNDARHFMVGWPELGVQNGWLVLDRNGNGVIDDLSEFFGDVTSQPKPEAGKQRNGFAALAVYDSLEQGGNGDGWISKEDRIFDNLRVWIDLNHDGISQPDELFTLRQVGIAEISLDYQYSRRTDNNGNVFRYKSVVKDNFGGTTAKLIYDVYVGISDPHTTVSTQSFHANGTWPLAPTVVGFTAK